MRGKRARLYQHRAILSLSGDHFMMSTLVVSDKQPESAVYRETVAAGEPWLHEVKAGQTLRIVDLEGNQAVDTLFYSLADPRERFDPQRTLRRQKRLYLSSGSVLYS